MSRQPHERASFLRANGLSIALLGLFVAFTGAQIATGHAAYDADRSLWGLGAVDLPAYLRSGHFIEALFENWESEFLQMGVFVLLSVKLRQRGSSESKPVDESPESDESPEPKGTPPWPVRRGGVWLKLYENSLATAFFSLFALSLALHAIGGAMQNNEELTAHGRQAETLLEFLASSQFWFESFQNWQSEFLAVLALVVFTIFLRQRGSPQSKPVEAPHWVTEP